MSEAGPGLTRLRQLVAKQAYRHGRFTLASGKTSEHYVNGKTVLLEPEGSRLFAKWITSEIGNLEAPPVAIGGLELGAIPIACAVMAESGELRTFIVRKKQKEHGAGLQVEGRLESGDRVVVVDDVITTGGSTLKAVRTVENLGCEVAAIYCLVNREDELEPDLEHYPLYAAMTLSQLLEHR